MILIHKNICFEVIQNGDKSNKVLKAWTEVCHQLFSDKEVKIMWNLQQNVCFSKKKMMFTNG